jgi:hypothetical protein
VISQTRANLARCDGYGVYADGGSVGSVEEIWLGAWDEPTAVVVRLLDGRRGLVLASDVAGVWPSSRFLTIAKAARVLELEPPHLDPGADGTETPVASWRTSGDILALRERPRLDRLRPEALRSSRAVVEEKNERPLWQTIAGLYLSVTAIVLVLIAVDILLSYLVTGSPPY